MEKERLLKILNTKEEELFAYLKEEFISNMLRPCFQGWVSSIYFNKGDDWDVLERHSGNLSYTDCDYNTFVIDIKIGESVGELTCGCDPEGKYDGLLEMSGEKKEEILSKLQELDKEREEEDEEPLEWSEKVEFIEENYDDILEMWNKDYLEDYWNNYERESLYDEIIRRIDELDFEKKMTEQLYG